MTDDPNEAYEVHPMPKELHGPEGWWMVTCNGVKVRSSPDKAVMERFATDPAWRAELRAKETPLHRRPGFEK